MKRIGIDARLLFQTGVGTYVQNLIHYLSSKAIHHYEFRAYILPSDKEKAQRWFPNFTFIDSPYHWHTFSEQIGFGLQLLSERLDLVHFTYFGHPIWYPGKFVSTVHDITPLLYRTGRTSAVSPLGYGMKRLIYAAVLGNQVHRSVRIITPTESVREQLLAYFGDGVAEKITTVYEGVSYLLERETSTSEKRLHAKPYILYVGNYYPHKNIERMIRGYLRSKRHFDLVLTGPDDYFRAKLFSAVPELGTNISIRFVSSPTVHDVAALYRSSEAVVNPSLSEGFGLPLAEAAYFDKPVICSDIPVFRELLGTSFSSFDPYNINSISSAFGIFEKEKIHKTATLSVPMSFQKMTEKIMTIYGQYA